MNDEDRSILGRRAVLAHLPKDDVIMQRGDVVDRVYLPVTADISNVIPLADGAVAMASNVGREGVTGLAAFMANEPIGWDLLVAVGGSAIMIPAAAFRERFEASSHLLGLLLSLTHRNQKEAAQNAVCNTLHAVTARLARWLLMTQDRTGQDEFELRQDDLAQLLGVQRTTINGVWRTFIEDDAVRGTRGRIRIVDRAVLQRFTCECYATLAAEPGWNGPRPTGSLSI